MVSNKKYNNHQTKITDIPILKEMKNGIGDNQKWIIDG
jgi:hypothetical protein